MNYYTLLIVLLYFKLSVSAETNRDSWNNRPNLYPISEGNILKYNYKAIVWTSSSKNYEHKSGYQIKSKVLISQVRNGWTEMRLVDLQLSKINGIYSNIHDNNDAKFSPQLTSDEFVGELSKAVQFQFDWGTFESLKTDKNDPFWSVNIKKGIIDMLQFKIKIKNSSVKPLIDTIDDNVFDGKYVQFSIFEDGIKGNCETNYIGLENKINLSSHLTLNYTKIRNYQNCSSVSSIKHHNMNLKHFKNDKIKQTKMDKKLRQSLADNYKNMDQFNELPFEHFSTYKYNISYNSNGLIADGIINLGKIVFKNDQMNFITETYQNLQLLQISKRKKVESFLDAQKVVNYNSLSYSIWDPKNDSKSFVEIPYLHLFSRPNQTELVRLALNYLHQISMDIVDGLNINDKIGYKIDRIVEIFASLDYNHLLEVWLQIIKSGSSSSTDFTYTKRNLFLDLIPYAGTNYAANLIKYSLAGQISLHKNHFEARNLIENLAENVYLPNEETIEGYFNLLKKLYNRNSSNQLITPLALSWAKMVKSLCLESQKLSETSKRQSIEADSQQIFFYNCTNHDLENYILSIHRWLQNDPNYSNKILFAQTLVYFDHQIALDLLKPYITKSFDEINSINGLSQRQLIKKREEHNFLRTSIIYALHNIINDHNQEWIRNYVLPVFINNQESYDLRLAAFTVFMASNPEEYQVESIASSLKLENNLQVISMVKSLLENFAKLKSSTSARIAGIARKVLPSIKSINLDEDDVKLSKASWNEYFLSKNSFNFILNNNNDNDENDLEKKHHLGINFNWQFVANNRSQFYRAFHTNLAQLWPFNHNDLFTFAFQQKGFNESYLLMEQNLPSKRSKSIVNDLEKSVHSIWNRFYSSHDDDTFRSKIYLKLFGKSSIFILDSQSMFEFNKHLNQQINAMKEHLNDGQKINYAKVFLPNSYRALLPTDIGLPIYLHQSNPTLLTVNISQANIDCRSNSIASINFTGLIEPTIWHQSTTSIQTIITGIEQAAGIYSVKKSIISIPVQLSMNLSNQTFNYLLTDQESTFKTIKSLAAFISKADINLKPNQSPIIEKEQI